MFKNYSKISSLIKIIILIISSILLGHAVTNNSSYAKKVSKNLDNIAPEITSDSIAQTEFVRGKEIDLALKWKTPIGLTTFRSTISLANNLIIVGSNGESLSSLNDSQDGVYLINPKTGEIKRHIQNEMGEDSDINGVAIYGDNLFFGSDNSYLFSYSFDGNKNWSFATDGDVEGAPSLTDITGDSFPDVVFTTENGSVYALNGKDGALIWNFVAKMEQTPGKYEYLSSNAFMSSPAVFDINQDGVKDVLVGARNAIFYAIDGKTGEVIWKYHTGSGIHSSAMVANVLGKQQIIFAEAYSDIHILDNDGRLQNKKELYAYSQGIQGLFSSPVYTDKNNIVIGSSWWDNEDDGFWIVPLGYENTEPQPQPLFLGVKNVSATPLIADIIGNQKSQIIIATEDGKLIISNEQGYILATMSLESGVEATPLIADIDNDGKNELLIAARDGYLYCYETNGSGIHWGQFRGNNLNTGVLKDRN